MATAKKDEIYVIESVPPPPGESVHEAETKIGDFAPVLAELRHAANEAKSTSKVEPFDLVSVLRAGDRHASGTRPVARRTASADERSASAATEHVIAETTYARAPAEQVEVVTLPKEEVAIVAADKPRASGSGVASRVLLDLLVVGLVCAAIAVALGR
jgi:hypothetical protein